MLPPESNSGWKGGEVTPPEVRPEDCAHAVIATGSGGLMWPPGSPRSYWAYCYHCGKSMPLPTWDDAEGAVQP